MNYTGKKVLVIGTGLSGIGAAQLLSKAGAAVTLLDQNEKAQEDQIRSKFDNTLTAEQMSRINIVIGDLSQVTSDSAAAGETPGFDLVVPSPAVPLDSPLVERMLLAGVPVISEIELGFLFEKGKVLALQEQTERPLQQRLWVRS